MNLESIGSLAEILSAAGVIFSLIYVGFQVSQNTRAMHAASIDAHITSSNFVREQIVANPDVADIYHRGNANPDDLSELEKVRYRILLTSILWTSWNAYAQTKLTGLSASTFEAQKPFIKRVLTTAGGRWVWDEYQNEFEADFRDAIGLVIESG
ncbi:MAG: hypothetical protein ACI9BW_000813 [Gammaproteobacteria bacterium]|jgi:hypothetical protein